MKRRILASLLSLVMALSLLPATALAEGEIMTVSEDTEAVGKPEEVTEPTPQAGDGGNTIETMTNGQLDLAEGSIVISADGYTQGESALVEYGGDYTITQTGSTTATTNTITVVGGTHTITLNGVNIDVSGKHDGANAEKKNACAFDIQGGDVALTLEGENVLKSGFTCGGYVDKYSLLCAAGWVCAGLSVAENASVTIKGNGSLDATAGGSDGFKIDEKSISWANAGKAAGIGVSCRYSNYSLWEATAGDITINDGIVNATGSSYSGGYGGPGIGGGSNVSNITINGGTVTATSNVVGSAGIGSSYGHAAKKHIVITGGTVTATGGSAGIGGGGYAAADVTIKGGNVTAKSTVSGAGIGSGGGAYNGSANTEKETTVTISGGTVTATGSEYSAGIGGGGTSTNAAPGGGRPSGIITISGGTITAKGGKRAPGIGSGSLGEKAVKNGSTIDTLPVSGKMETITISGGTITAVNGTGYSGTPYTLNDGTGAKSFGVGMGENPSEDAKFKFANWKLQTADGDAVQLIAVKDASNLKRNGKDYMPATLNISGTAYYLLPEGCYNTGTDSAEVVIPSDAVTSTVTDLITALNKIDPTKDSFTPEEVEAVRGYAATYNSLSESLQYYVDQQTKGHTLAEIQKAFEGKVDAKVTLKNGDKTFKTETLKYGGEYDLSGIVPTKANYKFAGWYFGDTDMTKGDSWPYLSDTTLEAKWVSEIEGSGTQNDPYIIKSGANLAALSHISLYVWNGTKNVCYGTAEEFALFGKTGVTEVNRTDLMSAYYKLGDNVTLTTADKFYGISGFKGHFDGDGRTITLNIDTTNIVESSDKDESGNEVAVGASSKRGKLKLTIGESTVYVNINMGVFNSATGARIENFNTSGSAKVLTNSAFTGVVIGESYGCTIKNITNKATLELGATDNTSWAGGIAGMVGSANPTSFVDCHNTAAIKGGTFNTSMGNSSAAGICSYQNASATYENCSNSGALIAERNMEASGRYSNAGGIVGLATGAVTATFKNCSNTGAISSQAQSNNVAAGIIVVNGSNTVIALDSCSNTAVITAKLGYTGALVSCKSGTSGMPTSAGYTNCTHVMKGAGSTDYTFGSTKATAAEEGQVVLTIPVENNADNFYAADHYVSANGEKVADIASADYQYIYNDFSHNGNIMEDSYPFQTEATAYVINTAEDYTNLVKALQGDADAQNAVLGNRFGNESTDAKKVALSNIYVKVNNNITLTDLDAMGIGSDARTFGGHILGQGHTITYNLSSDALSEAQSSSFGFVGVSDGAEVKDLNFAGNVNITVAPENSKNVYFGAAVVSGSGATITNCHSTVNYTVSRTSTVMNATGGFLEVGGLLGIQASATVENSTYTGSITVTSPKFARAGGIAAEFAGTMKNCVVKGNISAMLQYDSALPTFGESAYAGGMAGLVSSNSTFENCVAVGSMKAENTCNSANVGIYGCAYAGGLIGNATAAVTVKDSMALTTQQADAAKGPASKYAGSFAAQMTGADLTLSGTNWYVKTADAAEVSDATPIDTTVLNGKTYGDETTMKVPTGVIMKSDYTALEGSKVSFIKATEESKTGTVKLVYGGQEFFTTEITVAKKDLTNDSKVVITGINSVYPNADDAAAAKDNISVFYNGTKLVESTDYTVTQDTANSKFTISFIGNYTGSVEKPYTVDTGALVVTATDYNGTYDGKTHSIIVKASEGVTVKYGEAKATYTQDSIAKKDAGTYVVYWKATKDDKEITGSAVITIKKAPLTIKADDMSMTVGGTLPKFTYTSTGLVNGDGLATEPKLACTADGSVAGTYSIVPSGADAGSNYEITYVNGTLTIYSRSSGGGSSSSGSSYTVSVPSTKNGDVTVSPKNASKGDTVTITVKPDSGYELDTLTVKDASGNKLKLTDKGDGKYTFTMPGSKVTVSAEFVEEQAASIFADVPADAYYAKAVEWAVKKGITNGKANGLFGSNDPCTRGQIVTFLWRAAGSPAPKGTAKVPGDVLPGSYCYNAVAWAIENGITNGFADGTFGVNNTCTRGQSVTLLYRALGKAPTTVNGFTDVAADAFCADAVAWAVESGVTNGTSANTFSPNNGCTRAQIVTFLYRAKN